MGRHHIKMVLQYDGTDFNGWQVQAKQPHSRTVQHVLEQALAVLTGESIRVHAAGRTDAGVHARGQVVSFASSSSVPVERYPKALNGILPQDVFVRSAEAVDEGFHARFSAKEKTYIYRITIGPCPDIFWSRFSYHLTLPPEVGKMRQAAALVPGRRDFSSFCASGSSVSDHVREVRQCQVSENKTSDLIEVTVTADGFLYNMVRIIAGTLLAVGTGKMESRDIPRIIAAKDRSLAGPTAPAKGLTLEKVAY